MQEEPHSVHGHTHSVRRCTHEARVTLTISGHEPLFTSLRFYGTKLMIMGFKVCMMNILIRLRIHIHDSMLWVLSLWPQELTRSAKIDEFPRWLYSWQVLTHFPRSSPVYIHVCTSYDFRAQHRNYDMTGWCYRQFTAALGAQLLQANQTVNILWGSQCRMIGNKLETPVTFIPHLHVGNILRKATRCLPRPQFSDECLNMQDFPVSSHTGNDTERSCMLKHLLGLNKHPVACYLHVEWT